MQNKLNKVQDLMNNINNNELKKIIENSGISKSQSNLIKEILSAAKIKNLKIENLLTKSASYGFTLCQNIT